MNKPGKEEKWKKEEGRSRKWSQWKKKSKYTDGSMKPKYIYIYIYMKRDNITIKDKTKSKWESSSKFPSGIG